jgi:hypothetical protein
MADTPKRFFGPKQLANSATTEYTVPGATTAVILQLWFSNPTTGDATVTLSLGADAAGTRLLGTYTVPANSVFAPSCYHVMTAGEILQVYASAATTIVGSASGVEST